MSSDFFDRMAATAPKDHPYRRFLEVMEAIEDAENHEGRILALFDCTQVEITIDDLQDLAGRYRKLEKERDELDEKLGAMKRRIEDILEDF